MEIKDRTQANYNLVDINEQTRIAFEKCKKTKEQKIKRLKLEIENRKGTREFLLQSLSLDSLVVKDENETIARLEQQLKELEDGGRNSKN